MLVVSLIIALFFLYSFIWAIRSGQYDDDYTPSVRILFEDETVQTPAKQTPQLNKENNGSSKI